MTDSFNISISGEDILARLIAAERNNESLTAYIQRVETDLGERITATDRARARGDDGQHDLVTRTANAIYAEVKKLEQRISDCELAVGTDKLANDPEPPVDTSWHPYYAEVDWPDGVHPSGNRRVVVMLRNGEINRGPAEAEYIEGKAN